MRVPTKYLVQIAGDVLLTLLFLVLMGFFFHGDVLHEWAGILFFLLILPHAGANVYWFRKLVQEPFSFYRGLQVFLNCTLTVILLVVTISGVMLSQHALVNLPIHSDAPLVRAVHTCSVYWMVVIIGLHLGIHWNMLREFFCRLLKSDGRSFAARRLLPLLWFGLAGYGAYQFAARKIVDILFVRTAYPFFDFSESKWMFYLGFFSILIFFAVVTHLLFRLLLFQKPERALPDTPPPAK